MIKIGGYRCDRCDASFGLSGVEHEPASAHLLLRLPMAETVCPRCDARGAVRPVLRGSDRLSASGSDPELYTVRELYAALTGQGLPDQINPSNELVGAVLRDHGVARVVFENESLSLPGTESSRVIKTLVLDNGLRLELGVGSGGAVVQRMWRK